MSFAIDAPAKLAEFQLLTMAEGIGIVVIRIFNAAIVAKKAAAEMCFEKFGSD